MISAFTQIKIVYINKTLTCKSLCLRGTIWHWRISPKMKKFCSPELIRGVDGELIFLSALNIFLSIAAFLGNTLILVALHKETSLHPPSKLLYRNLAITDLCVGIIAEPLYVTYITSVVNERWDICHYANWAARFSGQTLCSVSLVTLTAISVDRLLAVLLGLRYRQVVTLRRMCITVIGFWILSIVSASSFFWNRVISSFSQYIVQLRAYSSQSSLTQKLSSLCVTIKFVLTMFRAMFLEDNQAKQFHWT